MHYRHIAYGLKIESAVELPELGDRIDFEGKPDVAVVLGEVDPFPADFDTDWNVADWPDPTHFRFRTTEGTYFAVRGGREITVMPHPSAAAGLMRAFLLGSVFGVLLLQRGFLTLHGNAVRIGEASLVCIGDSGVGKSTLAAAFLKRGFDVLADDVVAVDEAGCAVPSFPRFKLWQDAADRLGLSTDALTRIAPDMDKYNLHIPRYDPDLRLPIRWIYLLSCNDVGGIHIEPVVGVDRFHLLSEHTYRKEFIRKDMQVDHLRRCSRLASQIHLAKVSRPSVGVPLNLLVNTLLEDVERNSDSRAAGN